jgi:ABC-type phosphate transport system substrate-binding protein
MKIRYPLLAIMLASLALAACQPAASKPLPTVAAVRVQYTPAMQPALKSLSGCASQIPGVGLVVTELPADRMDFAKADLSLRFGSPGQTPGFSAAIGSDDVVVVVNASNHTAVQPGDLAAIYTGRIRDWNDAAKSQPASSSVTPAPNPIQVWSYTPGDDVRDVFTKDLLDGTAIAERVNLAPNPAAMLQAVASDPAAIGYLPRSLVTSQIRVLDFAGKKPAPAPLLALASAEPQGLTRALLACLQQ